MLADYSDRLAWVPNGTAGQSFLFCSSTTTVSPSTMSRIRGSQQRYAVVMTEPRHEDGVTTYCVYQRVRTPVKMYTRTHIRHSRFHWSCSHPPTLPTSQYEGVQPILLRATFTLALCAAQGKDCLAVCSLCLLCRYLLATSGSSSWIRQFVCARRHRT